MWLSCFMRITSDAVMIKLCDFKTSKWTLFLIVHLINELPGTSKQCYKLLNITTNT